MLVISVHVIDHEGVWFAANLRRVVPVVTENNDSMYDMTSFEELHRFMELLQKKLLDI